MQIEVYSAKSPSKQKIEDAYAVNKAKSIYGVFDGVTPLDTPANPAEDNGARKASQLFKKHFEQPETSPNLAEEIVRANRTLRHEMMKAGVDLAQKHLLWAACAAVVHIGSTVISYAQLGDCMVMVQDRQNNIRVLTNNQVDGIEQRAAKKREADRQLGIDVPDENYFADSLHQEIYARSMANTPEGYGVANGMEEMRDFIQTGQVNRSNVQSILLLTDGLFYPDLPYAEIMQKVAAMGLQSYAEDLARLEQEKGCRMDDKTGIWIKGLQQMHI